MASNWIAYNDLAWTEDWFVNPCDYEKEVMFYINLINENAIENPKTLLHFESGAGGHDTIFKKYFSVTGVDLSLGMIEKAKNLHPDIVYIEGDMRTVRLNKKYDVVAIPDSIDYMVSEKDLEQAIRTAYIHLNANGVLLIVAKPKETFQNNNFAYTGEKNGIHITLLENNYINPFVPNTYEATLVYLIRENKELSIHTERQILGLFPENTWERIFIETGFTMNKSLVEDIYEKNIIGEGEYPLTVFVGRKK